MCRYSPFFEFPLFIRSQWVTESILASSIQNPALNPKFRYYVILDSSQVVLVRRAKAFI